MLAGTEIAKAFSDAGPWLAIRDGQRISDADLKIGANSCDVSVGKTLLLVHPAEFGGVIDLHDPNSASTMETEIGCYGFDLQPGILYLASTRERFETHQPLDGQRFVQCIEGRSTVARVGMSVHESAGFGDWGFCSYWVLELRVMYLTRIYAGDRLAQIAWHQLEGEPQHYDGAYTNQTRGPRAAELGRHRF